MEKCSLIISSVPHFTFVGLKVGLRHGDQAAAYLAKGAPLSGKVTQHCAKSTRLGTRVPPRSLKSMPTPDGHAKCPDAPAQQGDIKKITATWRLWVVASVAALCGCLFGLDLGRPSAPGPGCSILQICIAQDDTQFSMRQVVRPRVAGMLSNAGIAGGVASMDGFLEVRSLRLPDNQHTEACQLSTSASPWSHSRCVAA